MASGYAGGYFTRWIARPCEAATLLRPQDIKRLKTLLVRTLVGTLEPQTPDDLVQVLRRRGEDIPLPELAHLLDALQAEGRIMRHAQKSRAWLFRPQSHTQAPGFTIKKAETPQAPAADMHRTGSPCDFSHALPGQVA